MNLIGDMRQRSECCYGPHQYSQLVSISLSKLSIVLFLISRAFHVMYTCQCVLMPKAYCTLQYEFKALPCCWSGIFVPDDPNRHQGGTPPCSKQTGVKILFYIIVLIENLLGMDVVQQHCANGKGNECSPDTARYVLIHSHVMY